MGRWHFTDRRLRHTDHHNFVFTTDINQNDEWERIGKWVEENQPIMDEHTIERLVKISTNTDAFNALCNELDKLQEGIVHKIKRGAKPKLSKSNDLKFSMKINFDPMNVSDTARLYELLKQMQALSSVTLEPVTYTYSIAKE